MSRKPINKIKMRSHAPRNDPWSFFGNLREQGPVIRIKFPIFGTTWAATTYETVSAVLKSDKQFVRDPRNAGRKKFIQFQWMLPRVFFSLIHNMLGADGAKHRRLRSIVDKAFALRNIESMSQRIDALAIEQMEIVQQIARHERKVDLIEHSARPFPLTVICELLGLPEEDRPKFREWFAPFSNVKSIFGMFTIGRGIKKMSAYLKEQFEEVRANPRDGLLSELVKIEDEGGQLDEKELLSMVFLLLVAGHETTVHLISNSLLTLLGHRDALDELRHDWTKCDSAIDEVLRFSSPLQMAKPRFVVEDMEFYGTNLKRGEMITPLIAAANYDPARFENPHEFNINRKSNYHMSFGSGPHTCLGMKLARAETTAALKALFEVWPNVRADFDLEKPDWSNRLGTRGIKTFVVTSGKQHV